ncbi:hypothetical protein ES705_14143 [subsurface metagenome]
MPKKYDSSLQFPLSSFQMIILCKKLKKVQFQSNLFPQLIIYNIKDYIDGVKFPCERTSIIQQKICDGGGLSS